MLKQMNSRHHKIHIAALLILSSVLAVQPAHPQENQPKENQPKESQSGENQQSENQADEASSNQNNNETFVVNLKNADIRSLIETVSKKTGKNFIVDPRVKATVTMVSSEPLDQNKLYEVFLSVLDVHGYAAVTSGAVIKIVPSTVGAQSAIPVLVDPAESGAALVSRVIYLQALPAQQLAETLRPLIPATASISAESNSNTLIVTDRADNIEKLISLINMMDQN